MPGGGFVNMLAKSLIPSVSMISLGTPKLAARVSESRPLAVSLNSSSAALSCWEKKVVMKMVTDSKICLLFAVREVGGTLYLHQHLFQEPTSYSQ